MPSQVKRAASILRLTELGKDFHPPMPFTDQGHTGEKSHTG